MVYAARLCSQWQAHDGGPVFSPMSGCSAGAGEKGVELMSYYHICPICGAALDPGERCDCQAESKPSTKLEKTEKFPPCRPGAGTPERQGGNWIADPYFHLQFNEITGGNQA